MSYEDQVRRRMEQDAAQGAALSVDYPNTFKMRQFVKDSKKLRKTAGRGRPKAAQRKVTP
jgi:hypothetical protein